MTTRHDIHEKNAVFKINKIGRKWIEVSNISEIECTRTDSFFEYNCEHSLPKVGKNKNFKIEKSQIREGDFIISNINKTNVLIGNIFRLELKRIIQTKSQIENLSW